MVFVFIRKAHTRFTTEPIAKFVPATTIAKPVRTKGAIGVCLRIYQRWTVIIACHLSRKWHIFVIFIWRTRQQLFFTFFRTVVADKVKHAMTSMTNNVSSLYRQLPGLLSFLKDFEKIVKTRKQLRIRR
ncbi:hypothetical protein OESDEN_22116 [Oesophagostomum dentatum]|uniref:Uncharacterized protein n=1 Tax=Oesophagostomum dentatum TaxID=61180 RepID=A0A0B1RZZ7_OESDE|nr:hypothetical protein OESDEN_22116 [Oesophagostomum dentatum]